MSHPLNGFDIQALNFKCFDEQGSGYFSFDPISVVIGKNNSGKSSVIDLVQSCINRGQAEFIPDYQVRRSGVPAIDIREHLDANRIKTKFQSSRHSGAFGTQNDWEYGRNFVSEPPIWRYTGNGEPKLVGCYNFEIMESRIRKTVEPMLAGLKNWPFSNFTLLRVAAERSVGPENSSNPPEPAPNGDGITNLIRFFINNDSKPRDLVEKDLLNDLNKIYLGDCCFESIVCQENNQGIWEIFLREQDQTDVRLSESGSSLQSIFIILSYFRLVPHLKNIQWEFLILALEEPENNLHPALLRRLLHFLAEEREKFGFSLVLTTHSPICIDWATRREDTCLLHVRRSGSSSKCKNVMDYDDRANILEDLDVRGSDILQSNGVIWVEGPTDRVYLKRWINLISSNTLIEGSHYTFMYYGGKVLAHFEAVPESELSTLVSMVTLNRNVAILMDSDRKKKPGTKRKPSMRLNNTKKRLLSEVSDRRGFSWVTAGKEIENYVPASVWESIAGQKLRIVDEFVDIPKIMISKKAVNTKIDLAHKAVDLLEESHLENVLDLKLRITELVGHIKRWNAIEESETTNSSASR